MATPTTNTDFLGHLRLSRLLSEERVGQYLDELRAKSDLPDEPKLIANRFVRDGLLTAFQAQLLLQGRHRNFIVGHYKILQPLGSGGMSKVYLVEHIEMGHRVAMKVLTKKHGKIDPSLLARFLREARVAGQLDHPNVVRTHDIDSSGGEVHYIILDFVDGVSLDALTRKRGRLKPAHAAHYVAQVACGLQHVHESGLIHRDIKPGNLLVDRSGVVKLLDLGLARLQEDQERLTAKFNDGAILGTADFIAPEQSLAGTEIDHRADLYGLGCTFYFLLTGRVPFEGNIAKKLIGHQMREPEPVTKAAPDTPAKLQQVLRRLMAKKPGDRYQSAAEVLRDLAKWLEIAVPPPGDDELPRLGVAALGSGPGSKVRPPSSIHLAAARSTIANLGKTTASLPAAPAPWRLNWKWFALAAMAAIAALGAAAITWLLVTRAAA